MQNLSEATRYRILAWVAYSLLAIPKAATRMITSRSSTPGNGTPVPSQVPRPEEDDQWMIFTLLQSLVQLLALVTAGLFTSKPAIEPPHHFPVGEVLERHQGWEAMIPKQPGSKSGQKRRG